MEQQLKIISKHDLLNLEQIHTTHLSKIKISNFDIQEFIDYQDILTDYIMQFYNDSNFQDYQKNPKLFIKTKTKEQIVNAVFTKHCFNLIDVLDVYINAIETVVIHNPIALANTIIMELVWSQQQLTKELEIYL